MKHLFVLVLFGSIFFKVNRSMDIWKDKSFNFLDYDEANSNFDDKCGENELCQSSFDDLNKRTPKENEDLIFKTATKKEARLTPFYHSSRPLSCACEIEFRVLDLGHQYYPRYLHTGVCKSEMCGGLYHCIEKHYKVRVLKQKDQRSSELKTLTFPENLKSVWQPELVTVTVACECAL